MINTINTNTKLNAKEERALRQIFDLQKGKKI
jgi:hypothetical protein